MGDIMKKIFFIGGIFFVLMTFFGVYVFKEETKDTPKHNLITVNIDGAIKIPGFYEVSPTKVLEDLIFYAGGVLIEADLTLVDKNESLKNYQTYYIPFTEELVSYKEPLKALININKANKEELMSLPGIGEIKAEAIIEYRNKNGPFKELSDLMNVTGIGEKIYEQLLEKITI